MHPPQARDRSPSPRMPLAAHAVWNDTGPDVPLYFGTPHTLNTLPPGWVVGPGGECKIGERKPVKPPPPPYPPPSDNVFPGVHPAPPCTQQAKVGRWRNGSLRQHPTVGNQRARSSSPRQPPLVANQGASNRGRSSGPSHNRQPWLMYKQLPPTSPHLMVDNLGNPLVLV